MSAEWSGVWLPLWLSLKVASFATVLTLLVGVPLGYALSRPGLRGREILDAVLTLPMVLPPTVIGYYLLVLLGSNSPLGAWFLARGIEFVFSVKGAVLASAVVAYPLVFKAARAAFEAVPQDLEDAARTLGLSGTAVFFRVSLPLAWNGISSGLLLGFARSMGEFGATLMIAGSIEGQTQTLSIAVYEAVQGGQDSRAASLALLTSVVSLFVLLAVGRLKPRAAV